MSAFCRKNQKLSKSYAIVDYGPRFFALFASFDIQDSGYGLFRHTTIDCFHFDSDETIIESQSKIDYIGQD